jgi:septal ring factor EnvC (AmiA/AmiB activator)
MSRIPALQSKRIRTIAFSVLAFGTMAFTFPGCPDVEGLNAKIAELEQKSTAQQRQVQELAEQMRILNDEHNTVKQLVSQISSTVLEQRDTIERLENSVKQSSVRRAAPTPAKKQAPSRSAPARRRR